MIFNNCNLLISLVILIAFIISEGNSFIIVTSHSTKNSRVPVRASTEDQAKNEGEVMGGTKNPLRLMVLKLGFTEPRFTSLLNNEKRDGLYSCQGCGNILFESDGKYDSRSGWPSFFKTIKSDVGDGDTSVKFKREFDGRIECSCGQCGGHLGHIFPDGPTPQSLGNKVTLEEVYTGFRSKEGGLPNRMPRYCINGAALKFKPT